MRWRPRPSGVRFDLEHWRVALARHALAAAAVGWLSGAGPVAGQPAPQSGASPPTGGVSPTRQAAWRFEGEYGLYVGVYDGALDVRWLTGVPFPGLVRAIVDGRVVHEERTERGNRHRAWLRVDAPVVTLEYGVDQPGHLHRTDVRLALPAPPETELPIPDSVFVFGDVHGEHTRVVTLLAQVGLIKVETVDADLRWTGGTATVVLLGDVMDRGEDVTRLFWFLYRLEREARAAGGRVITMLGNHEALVMSGDLRYVSPKETAVADRHGISYAKMFAPATSILGRWLAAKPGLVRLGDLLLAHGGVSPEYLDYSLRAYQDSLSAYISEPLFTGWRDPEFMEAFTGATRLDDAQIYRRYNFFFAAESVLWYRDLARSATTAAHLDAVLDRFGARIHVVAHTPASTIRESYGGKLITVALLDPAAEMLFLERTPGGDWNRFAIPLSGDPRNVRAASQP